MVQKTLIFITALILHLYVGGIAQAFETEDILIHGFFSQGYLKTDKNNYLGNSEDGSYEFNEVGMNFTVPLTDALRFGVQFFSRDIGDYGNNEFQVDWGFLDYKWQDYLGFRAGKIKMPFGLYNRQRDADMLRTSILLPQSVYIEEYRDMLVAFQGASLYGIVRFGPIGYADYEVFTGTTELDGNSQFEIDHIIGGLLVWNTPISGLRIGNTNMQAEGKAANTFDFVANPVRVFSAEFQKGPLLISAEYARFEVEIEDHAVLDLEGWYTSVSWQIMEWIDTAITYSEYYPDDDDKSGRRYEAGATEYYAWQKDTTLSVRFNISEWWAVKLETHFMDGVGLLNDKTDSDKTWMLYAVKTSLTF